MVTLQERTLKCRCGLPQLVEAHGVAAQDLLLVAVAERCQVLRRVLQRFGVEAGGVRKIGVKHDPVCAQPLDDVGDVGTLDQVVA